MPQKQYEIKPKSSKKLTIKWKGGIFLIDKDIEVLFDDKIVKTFPKKEDLQKPKKIKLSDGSIITLQLEGKYNFIIKRNGKSLNSISSSRDRVSTFANIFVILGLFIIVYRWILLQQGTSLLDEWTLWVGLVGGGVLLISGISVRRKRYGYFLLGSLAFLVEFIIILYERYLQNLNIGTSLIIGAVIVYFIFSAALNIPRLNEKEN